MITRITGTLESVEPLAAVVHVEGSGLAYQVLIPAYFAERLREGPNGEGPLVGRRVTFHTLEYLEGQGQGSSFIPRLVGFPSPQDRKFFELLTTVEGLGNRKALRAMAQEPALIAQAIAGREAHWLTQLPEIGRKTAEKIVLELHAKAGQFLSTAELEALETASSSRRAPAPGAPGRHEATQAAVATLVALGETRPEAERLVQRALAADRSLKEAEEIVAAAYAAKAL